MSPEKHPDVSIIIPSYNRAESLMNAIRSVGAPRAATEIIVVDDGSTDGTPDVLKKNFPGRIDQQDTCGLPVIRLYTQMNKGASGARNLGLEYASGTFIKFLDSDDLLAEGVLDREVEHAERTGADVVVCGWIERVYEKELSGGFRQREVPAPGLERGIDDMLIGRSVWTAAALYRRTSVQGLRWDSAHGKADDWGWVWRVCLSGAVFSRLPVLSAIYCLYEGDRITQRGDPYFDSTRMRQLILQEVEDELRRTNRLTPERTEALIRYYLKDRIVLAARDPAAWRELCAHIDHLSPGFVPEEMHPWVRPFVKCFGLRRGIRIYALLSGAARSVCGGKRGGGR
jgi:glycosyltransferase involved in cell wall biosynthesis